MRFACCSYRRKHKQLSHLTYMYIRPILCNYLLRASNLKALKLCTALVSSCCLPLLCSATKHKCTRTHNPAVHVWLALCLKCGKFPHSNTISIHASRNCQRHFSCVCVCVDMRVQRNGRDKLTTKYAKRSNCMCAFRSHAHELRWSPQSILGAGLPAFASIFFGEFLRRWIADE